MNDNKKPPVAMTATDVEPRRRSAYPPMFAKRMEGREKRALGDAFGLKNFGVNLTSLDPGAVSALRHSHSRQDEFIYVLQGTATLITNDGETLIGPGMCAGFAAASGNAHCIANRSDGVVVYLEVGDRTAGDEVFYPDDDLKAVMQPDGKWAFTRKDGTPW